MEERKLTYKEVMELGFNRIDCRDSVFEEQNGYSYFIVEKKLLKRIHVDWDCETHELKLYKKNNLVRIIKPSELRLLMDLANRK